MRRIPDCLNRLFLNSRALKLTYVPFLTLAALVIHATPAYSAKDDATLRVVVSSSEDGTPLPGTNVLLMKDDEIKAAGSADSDGLVQLSGIEAGNYQLEVRFLGYETHEEDVELRPGQNFVRRVQLTPSVERLEEVIVEGHEGGAHRQAGLQTVSPRDLRRIPSPTPGGDLAMYLQSLPGIATRGDRGGEMFIRGGTPSQNIIMVDNIPVTQPFHISSLFSAFPGSIIQDVDFYAGGFGAEYTGGVSSVIDVTLRQGNMNEFAGEAAISPYMASIRAEGPIETNHRSLLVSARSSLINHFSEPLTGENIPIDFYDLTLRYTSRLPNFNCGVTAMHTYDEGQINPLREVNLSWTNTAIGGRCLMFGAALDQPIDISLGYSRYNNSEWTADQIERSSTIDLLHFRLDREYLATGFPISYGLRWDLARYYTELDELFFHYEDFEALIANFRAFASGRWQPTEELTVIPGFTSQFTTGKFAPTLEPRLRLSYRPDGTDRREFSLAAGRYYQMVEGLSDERDAGTVFTVWKPMDTISDPEPWAWHGILGYRRQLGHYFETTVEGFVKDHRNIPVSQWTPEARMELETTFANGLIYGADLRLEYDRRPLLLLLGYDWSKVTYEAATDDLGAWVDGEVFSYNPAHDLRHQVNFLAALDIGDFTTSLRWEFNSGQPYTRIRGNDVLIPTPDEDPSEFPGTALTIYDKPYGARLPSTHRLDVSVEHTVDFSQRGSLQTQVGVINSYNRNNIFYYDSSTFQRMDQTPLFPYVSLSATFN